jgi:hypothetical protein
MVSEWLSGIAGLPRRGDIRYNPASETEYEHGRRSPARPPPVMARLITDKS